ncbi:hypothetical protein GCM10020295_45460 [Streptomyces cinereospinus]
MVHKAVPQLTRPGRGPSCEVRPCEVRPERGGRDAGAVDYDAAMAKKLVIKVTAGADAPERCSQAFTVAAVAVASGVDVSVWLTGESAWFALPGRAAEFELPHAAPLPDLIDSVLAAGRLTLCTQCAARRDITEQDVIEGVRIAGAQVFVQEALAEDTQALVY